MPQLLENMARVTRRSSVAVVNHRDVQPLFDVYANIQDRDLGSVARDVDRVIDEIRPSLPRGTTISMRGIVWALFSTQTTLSVESLMGAIMSIGVATANCILIVSFANERHRARATAQEAAFTRLRPVIMTAFAMIVGMLPMALGLGEGGEHNAPLGRVVLRGASTRSGAPWMAIGAAVLVGGRLAAEIVPRLAREKRVAAEEGAATAIPSVSVAEVRAGTADVSLTLPATLLGLHEVGL